MEEKVILVDELDAVIGESEKMRAHELGLLHRAFSIMIFNSKNEVLLQQRALIKYHSGGLWANACCSHPRPGENLEKAAHRRLKEEMGFDCPLKEIFSFCYREDFGKGLIEHEYDHVFEGKYDGLIVPNPLEVAQYRWCTWDFLEADIKKNPKLYTYWLKEIVLRWRRE